MRKVLQEALQILFIDVCELKIHRVDMKILSGVFFLFCFVFLDGIKEERKMV